MIVESTKIKAEKAGIKGVKKLLGVKQINDYLVKDKPSICDHPNSGVLMVEGYKDFSGDFINIHYCKACFNKTKSK